MPVKAWLNGKLVTEEGGIGIADRGLLFGDGLFETVRVYSGRPFAWEEHRERLLAGCRRLGIPCPAEITTGVDALLRATALREGSLRVTVTRGEALRRGLLPAPGAAPTVLITAQDGRPYQESAYRRGFTAVTVSFPRNRLSPLAGLKSLNALENILGRLEASAAGADEGLFVNDRGELTEGTVSNLFIIPGDGSLVTPGRESGLLPGIARGLVLRMAPALGLAVREAAVGPERLLAAAEAFLTNSLLEVMPLVSFDGRPIGSGRPGTLTASLRLRYRSVCQVEE
jgi:branched-chain amino acid aminotransferase